MPIISHRVAPERQRRLLVLRWNGGDHLSRDRRHDREDHDREDQAGDEVVVEGRNAAPDPRYERERAREPLLGRQQTRREHEHPPQAVDDRRHRGEQVDQDRQRLPQPAWAHLVDEHGGATAIGTPMMMAIVDVTIVPTSSRTAVVDAAETSQSLPNTKLSPNWLNTVAGLADQANEEVDDQDEDRPRPGRRAPTSATRSGRRPAGDRSRAERPPVTLVALASTYTSLLRDRRAVADHRRQLRVVLVGERRGQRRVRGAGCSPARGSAVRPRTRT